MVGIDRLLLRDICRVFHDLERLATAADQWVVGGLDPDLFAALANPLVLSGLVFAAIEFRPKLSIFRTLLVGRLDKHSVMGALYLGERVSHRVEEICVGGDNRTVHVEFDDRLRFVECRDLCRGIAVKPWERHLPCLVVAASWKKALSGARSYLRQRVGISLIAVHYWCANLHRRANWLPGFSRNR